MNLISMMNKCDINLNKSYKIQRKFISIINIILYTELVLIINKKIK